MNRVASYQTAKKYALLTRACVGCHVCGRRLVEWTSGFPVTRNDMTHIVLNDDHPVQVCGKCRDSILMKVTE